MTERACQTATGTSWADYMMGLLTADKSLLEGCCAVVGGLHDLVIHGSQSWADYMVECCMADRSLSEDCFQVVGEHATLINACLNPCPLDKERHDLRVQNWNSPPRMKLVSFSGSLPEKAPTDQCCWWERAISWWWHVSTKLRMCKIILL